MAVGSVLLTSATPLFAAVPQPQLMDMHLTPNYLAYRYNDAPLAVGVVGYSYIGGMMLPLAQTADAMGSFVQVNGQAGTAAGWVENAENTFTLDMKNRSLSVGGEERMIPQGAMSVVGDEIYVDASYLATLLSSRFIINYDNKTVDVLPDHPLRVTKRMEFIQSYFDAIRTTHGEAVAPWGAVSTTTAPVGASKQGSNMPIAGTGGASMGAAGGGMATESGRGNAASPQTQGAGSGSTTHTTSQASQPQAPASPAATSSDEAPRTTSNRSSRHINWENIVLDTASLSNELKAVSNPVLSEDNLLILQPELDKVKGDYVEVYKHEHGYYVPLGHLMDMLELGIGVNPAEIQASGFFIDESRKFFLDGKNNTAVVDGKTINFPAGMVVANPFEVYVDAKLLSQLLPMDFLLDMSQLVLIVQTRETLPLQARIKRENEWSKMSSWKKGLLDMRAMEAAENIPLVETPYQAVATPIVEVANRNNYESRREDAISRTSILASGDIGYVNTETFAQIDTSKDDMLTNLRFKAGRTDNKGELLGPLKATEAYVGDVEAYPMALVTNSDLGRGAAISNRDVRRPREFDQTDFFGDAQPGWEVELYQNNILIDFQRVGEDGRYEFKGVPINFGDNEFRIVQYGPQGQKQEEVRSFNIDDAMPKPGEVKYAVSVNERESSLFNIDSTNNRSGTRSGEGIAGTGQVEYGLNENLAVSAGVAHVPVKNPAGNVGDFNFVSAGLKSSAFGWNTSWDNAYDVDNGGWATKLTALTRINNTNIRAEQRYYHDYESAETVRSLLRPLDVDLDGDGFPDEIRITNSPMESRTEISASRPFHVPVLENISAGLAFVNETFALGERDTSLNARVSKNLMGMNLSNNLRLRQVDGTNQSNGEYLDGGFSAYYRWDDSLLLRGIVNYELSPDLELSSTNLSAQKEFTDTLSGRLEYTQSFLGDEMKRLGLFLNWDLEKFYLSPRFEIDQEAEYNVGVDLIFSLGMDPRNHQPYISSERMARSGAISAQAFIDENADGVRDANEEVLKGAVFNSQRGEVPNEEGVTYMKRIAPHHPYRIVLDESSIEHPGVKPKEKAYGVVTRPGVTAVLDYPVVPTVEVEGIAYLEQDGEQLEYPGLELELVNEKGEVVDSVRTEFDGYYYVENIYPGKYTLRVSEKEVSSKGLMAEPFAIDTAAVRASDNKTGVVKNANFTVRRNLRAAAAEDFAEPIPTVPVIAEEAEPVAATPAQAAAPAQDEVLAVKPQVPVPAVPAQVAQPAPAQVLTPPAPKPVVSVPVTPQAPKKSKQLYVQSGLFCDQANAERHAETLTVAGFKAAIKDKEFKGKSCFNVRVGPQADYVAAEAMVKELKDMGVDKPVIIEESAETYE